MNFNNIFQPLTFGAIESHDVETTYRNTSATEQIELGGPDQPLLLGWRNTGSSSPENTILSFTYFYKDKYLSLQHNQIDFSEAASKIPLHDLQSSFSQKG